MTITSTKVILQDNNDLTEIDETYRESKPCVQ